MAWNVSFNEILRNDITKLDYTLIPPGFRADFHSVRVIQDSLEKIINQLGEQSAASQGLDKAITTAKKLRSSPSHILYLLKDPEANRGAGEVIGLLRVGRKHLYLTDAHNQLVEVEPMCVLDFYVAPGWQRRGHGRALFDRMLSDTGVEPRQLAIDGPSPKMEMFLAKNYGVDRLIRQSNNFAIAPDFFNSLRNVSVEPNSAQAPAVVGRYAAPKPHSAIGHVIHGGGNGLDGGDGTSRGSAPSSSSTEPAAPPAPASPLATVAPAAPATVQLAPSPSPSAATSASPPRPASLRVEPQAPASPPAAGLRSTASRSTTQVDGKFAHSKLW